MITGAQVNLLILRFFHFFQLVTKKIIQIIHLEKINVTYLLMMVKEHLHLVKMMILQKLVVSHIIIFTKLDV